MNEIAWSSSPNDAWNIYHLPPDELRSIYCTETHGYEWEYIRQVRKRFKKKINARRAPVPERTEPYQNPETERERVSSRRQRIAPATGGAALASLISPEDRARYHKELDDALNEYGAVSRATFRDWQSMSKDADGNARVTDLHGLRFDVKFDSQPEWPLVQRIESITLPKKESKKAPTDSKTAVVLPDIQLPYSSPEAVDIALQIVRETKPDKIILLGDLLDLAAFGKYQQRPEFAQQTQGAIVEAHQLLAKLRKLAPTAQIIVQEANHDRRLPDMLIANAQAAYGLKRADQPEGWPVMSIPFLCAFDKLDVEYNAGYPSNRVWINERLQVIHGAVARPGGKSASAVLHNERVSTIFGHTHRIESSYKTVNVYEGGRTNASWNIGCLCKIDGSVPSAKSGFDLDGKPVKNYMDWANGLAVIQFYEGDNNFNVEQIYINSMDNYKTIYRGKIYRPSGN